MRTLFVIFFLFVVWQMVFAQKDSLRTKGDTAAVRKDGEMRLSDSFLKALDGAFSFEPVAAPLPKQSELTTELLHEWVGKPTMADTARNASKFNETYKALKMWEKEFYVPISLNKHNIAPDLGPMPAPSNGASVSFDFNALGQYIRPKEIRLRKLRKQAKETLEALDQILPQLQSDLEGRRK